MPEPQGRNAQIKPETNRDVSKAGEQRSSEKLGEQRPSEGRSFTGGNPESPRAGLNPASLTPGRVGPDFWDSWRPFAPVALMQSEMVRWVEDFWRSALSTRSASVFAPLQGTGFPMMMGTPGVPRADLKETADTFKVHVELPGLKPQDIDVRLEGDDLLIRGTKSDGSGQTQADYHLSERRFGQFERRIPLPHEIDREAAQAEFHDGVLNVTLPKRANGKTFERRIEVRG